MADTAADRPAMDRVPRLVSTGTRAREGTTRATRVRLRPTTTRACRTRTPTSTSPSPRSLSLSILALTRLADRYNAPPEFGGQNSYAQQYGPPPGRPPVHYGVQEQQYNVPSQYQGGQFAMHAAPTGDQSQYYSNLSGRRKALCIGINYTGTRNQLNGCHNDARNMAKFLCERYNYKEEDIVMLLDTPDANQMSLPTRANMVRTWVVGRWEENANSAVVSQIRGMQWLVKDARPNDALFFHCESCNSLLPGNEVLGRC